MQQRGVTSNMEGQSETGEGVPQQSRVRNISKLKVLGRSHAMREETSPPREPTPTALNSPCIKLTPSADLQRMDDNLQCMDETLQCIDDTLQCNDVTHQCTDETLQSPSPPQSPLRPVLVLSPPISKGNSPCHTPTLSPTTTIVPSPTSDHKTEFTELDTASLNVNRLNIQNLERYDNRQKTEVIVEETSHVTKCDCSNSCARNKERNHNNNITSNNNNTVTANTLTVNRGNVRGKLRHQSSSQGSFEGSSSNSPCLSRDNSSEQYTDTTGVDLEQFIPETLNKNAKDRALMLRIEEELTQLAKDGGKSHYKFPPMSSYQRMLVHRCAAYFGMDHNIEPSGKCVVVNKTKNTRIPDVEFKQHIKEDLVFSEEPRRSILKRDSNSIEDYNFKSPERQSSLESRRSKSFEEREEEYVRARRRIFNKELQQMHNSESTDDLTWSEIRWYSTEGESVMRYNNNSECNIHGRTTGRLLKVQSEEAGEDTHRPCVAKSFSFGGYSVVLPRGDSMMSTHSAGPRLLTKQDSASSSVWRLSPSSSGYKSQSQRSESITPSPTSTPYLSGESNRQDSTNSTATNVSDLHQDDADNNQVVWAVTNINSVPKGSVIINPQTGKPMTNQDGSVYLFDPENPLPELKSPSAASSKPPPSPIKTPVKSIRERPQSPKKRTRSSPVHKANISTSPILPYTPAPPTPPPRSYSYEVHIPQLPMQPQAPSQSQQYQAYGQTYNTDNNIQPMYQQQPCIMFAPYTQVPVSYDGRMEGTDVSNYYDPNATSQPMTYQQQVWNQPPPLPYYQNNQPTMNAQPPRYSVPVPQQGTFFTYPPTYLPPPPPPAQNTEVGQMYSHHSVPVVYPPSQSNQVIYPNMYTQPPASQMYSNPVYPAQNVAAYPTNVPTPNSCISSGSNTQYPVFDQTGLSQNMAQMNLNAGPCNSKVEPGKQQAYFKGKFNSHKSSQSSTENSSPAMTVVANYNNQGMYNRNTTDTPPLVQPQSNFSPLIFRHMNNIKSSTPVTNRTSRSPTPANDTHIDRSQRYSMQPIVYQGLPYSMQPDTRIVPGRGQPAPFRPPQPRQHSLNQNDKFFRNRRTRGNRTLHLPPNGRYQYQYQQQQQLQQPQQQQPPR